MVGLGVTGIASVRYALARGAKVTICERTDSQEIREKIKEITTGYEVDVVLGEGYLVGLNYHDLVVLSPGVDPATPEITLVKESGVPIHNDVTLFLEEWNGRGHTIGVTGSNGKSTTVSIIYELLKANNIPTKLGGNIGVSPLDWLTNKEIADGTVVILEVSSFLLEQFSKEHYFDTFLLLNISDNHLNRYEGSIEKYMQVKLQGVAHKHTKLIVSGEDKLFYERASEMSGAENILSVHTKTIPEGNGVFIKNDTVVYKHEDHESVLLTDINKNKLIGSHNKENIVFALASILDLNTKIENNNRAVASFAGLPHRIEYVTKVSGVVYINDSKSTSPDATINALSAIDEEKNIVLIAGGEDKGADFSVLAEYFKKYLKALVLLPGEGSSKIEQMAKGSIDKISYAKNMKEAVLQAQEYAKSGDGVLLSPASASKNAFKGFEDRGEQFRKEVILLSKK